MDHQIPSITKVRLLDLYREVTHPYLAVVHEGRNVCRPIDREERDDVEEEDGRKRKQNPAVGAVEHQVCRNNHQI